MKLRKSAAIFAAASLFTALLAAPVYAENTSVEGVTVWDTAEGDTWSGANIILGTDAQEWPFASGEEEAFYPDEDATYRLTFNVTSTGASGFRVRWIKDNENGSYTAGDAAIVNDHVKAANEVATVIPAYFQGTINSGETKTYTVEFKTDGGQNADELIGNIAIRGQQGSNDFSINSITIEDEDGDVLVEWTKAAAAGVVTLPALITEPVITPLAAESASPVTADPSNVAAALCALCASVGLMVLASKLAKRSA